ncbi:CBO0543 family protein [Brevibacillus fulvus]|uniref:Uncharacterized protein n=1 Tax=Brevibacillus fulvus TaxID=1125967 RepID=A0A939BNI1_9BACL|nr:CBO0543 family protein [Brevibacillus fulvus]MBM7589080.1 hypothetical protein [Brevibacillus fulvus]
MHVLIGLYVIFWRWGDWRNWARYHPTMLYYAAGNLLYQYLTANHYLWRLLPDRFLNHTLTELLYTFLIFPGTALLFLGNFPASRGGKWRHYVRWYLLYVGMESVFVLTHHIDYQYGWNLLWSALFDLIMFPMLHLHHKRPLVAYGLSVLIIIILVWYFNVPIHIPIEQRK